MDVLHVCPSRSFSGLEQYVLAVAAYQKRAGHEVAVVVCPGAPLQSECKHLGIETVDFLYDVMRGRWSFWRRVIKILNKEKNLKAIHLHMTDEVANISIPIFWRKLRKLWNHRPKIIFQAHIWIKHKKRDFYHRLLYSNVDEVWCSSNPAKEALRKSLPSNVEIIKVFNYGRDIKRIKEDILDRDDARNFLKLKKGRKTIGTVSRIEKAKGIRELVEASVPLLDKDPDLEIVVIGGVSPNNSEAEEYMTRLENDLKKLPPKISERIILKGAIPESFRFLKAFDLYVLPSYLECFSLSLLDAQIAGLAAVGSQSGGTPELVKQNETGWLFKPESVRSMREALEEALAHQDLWTAYGKTAQKRVEKEFDQDIIFDAMYKAYTEKPDLEAKDDNPYKAPLKKRSKWLRREKPSVR